MSTKERIAEIDREIAYRKGTIDHNMAFFCGYYSSMDKYAMDRIKELECIKRYLQKGM